MVLRVGEFDLLDFELGTIVRHLVLHHDHLKGRLANKVLIIHGGCSMCLLLTTNLSVLLFSKHRLLRTLTVSRLFGICKSCSIFKAGLWLGFSLYRKKRVGVKKRQEGNRMTESGKMLSWFGNYLMLQLGLQKWIRGLVQSRNLVKSRVVSGQKNRFPRFARRLKSQIVALAARRTHAGVMGQLGDPLWSF